MSFFRADLVNRWIHLTAGTRYGNYPQPAVTAAAGASNRSAVYLVGTNFPESVALDRRMKVVPLFFNAQQTSIVIGR